MQNGQNQSQMQQQVQKQQMTEEELQRTQVLNFDTFKQVARYEKISSKKPAIIVALIGILAIVIGGTYPIVQSQMAKKEQESKSSVQARKKEKKSVATELVCTQSTSLVANGLDQAISIKYNFIDNKLTSFTKELTLTVTAGSTTGATSLQNFITALQPFLVQKEGYSVTVKQIENGVVTNTSVDYKTIDINSIPEMNQQNVYFNVIYLADSNRESIKEDMTNQNYICN